MRSSFGFLPRRGARYLAMNYVVPAEAHAIDLGAEHVLQPAPREAWIDARRLPVDDVLPCGRFARGAAQDRGERAGDDLHSLARGETGRLGGRRGRVRRVADDQHQLAPHDAAEAGVDQVAHELVALEVKLPLRREVAGERLEHAELVFALELLSLGNADTECERAGHAGGDDDVLHARSPPPEKG